MTELAFHTGLPDKLDYACRLLRKAWRQGARVLVTGSTAELARLDQALWVFEQEEFVPHLRLRAGESVPAALMHTPIWLVDDADGSAGALAEASVLVNLGPGYPSAPNQFARVIELVSTDEAEVHSARERWRSYAAQGLVPLNRPYAAAAAKPAS